MRFTLLFFPLILVVSGCGNRSSLPPADLLRLADAHVALLRLKAVRTPTDSTQSNGTFASRMTDSLAAYGFTKESFEAQMLSLSNAPERLRQFNDLITARTK